MFVFIVHYLDSGMRRNDGIVQGLDPGLRRDDGIRT